MRLDQMGLLRLVAILKSIGLLNNGGLKAGEFSCRRPIRCFISGVSSPPKGKLTTCWQLWRERRWTVSPTTQFILAAESERWLMTLPNAWNTGRAAHSKTDSIFSILIKEKIIHRRLNEHRCHLWEQWELSVGESHLAWSHAGGHRSVCDWA